MQARALPNFPAIPPVRLRDLGHYLRLAAWLRLHVESCVLENGNKASIRDCFAFLLPAAPCSSLLPALLVLPSRAQLLTTPLSPLPTSDGLARPGPRICRASQPLMISFPLPRTPPTHEGHCGRP